LISRGFPAFADHGILDSWREITIFSNARGIVEQAIGEHIDGSPLMNKGSRAVAGSKSGKIGGKASAEKLSAQKRKEIA
jgi:hypothetical protein